MKNTGSVPIAVLFLYLNIGSGFCLAQLLAGTLPHHFWEIALQLACGFTLWPRYMIFIIPHLLLLVCICPWSLLEFLKHPVTALHRPILPAAMVIGIFPLAYALIRRATPLCRYSSIRESVIDHCFVFLLAVIIGYSVLGTPFHFS